MNSLQIQHQRRQAHDQVSETNLSAPDTTTLWVLFEPLDDDILSSSFTKLTGDHVLLTDEELDPVPFTEHGLYERVLTRCEGLAATLQERIDEWQDQESFVQPYQSGRIALFVNTKGNRFYGDYLFQGLSEGDIDKVKLKAREFSSCLKQDRDDDYYTETVKNTAKNGSFFAHLFLRSLLLLLAFFGGEEKSVDMDTYWELGSSVLSVSSGGY